MDRIDHPTASPDENGAGKDGFTEGDPGVTVPTVVTSDWLNDVQESIVQTIEGAGLTPAEGDFDQLLDAVKALRDAHSVPNQVLSAAYQFDTGSGEISDTDNFVLEAASSPSLSADTGFTLGSLGTDIIGVPSLGRYEISLHGWLVSSSTANPLNTVVEVEVGGTPKGRFYGSPRFSATTSHKMLVSGSVIVDVTNIAHGIAFFNVSGAGMEPSVSLRIHVKRLRDDTLL